MGEWRDRARHARIRWQPTRFTQGPSRPRPARQPHPTMATRLAMRSACVACALGGGNGLRSLFSETFARKCDEKGVNDARDPAQDGQDKIDPVWLRRSGGGRRREASTGGGNARNPHTPRPCARALTKSRNRGRQTVDRKKGGQRRRQEGLKGRRKREEGSAVARLPGRETRPASPARHAITLVRRRAASVEATGGWRARGGMRSPIPPTPRRAP